MSNFEFQLRLFKEPVFPEEVPSMTNEEHIAFVKGLVSNEIFTSMHIHELDKKKDDLGKVFLVQGEGQFMLAKPSFIDDIGVIWEFLRESANKCHVGSISKVPYPVFPSARLCSKIDWDLACHSIKTKKSNESRGV